MIRKERGITLIALAITIIVMLIIAGVGINSLLSNGIIDQASNASEDVAINRGKQELTLNLLEAQLEKYEAAGETDYKTKLKEAVITKIDSSKYDVKEQDDDEVIIATKDGKYSYKITSTEVIYNGELEADKYTYYFEKPDNWGNTLYAHIWIDGGTSSTTWPGLQMTNVGIKEGKSVYKIEITKDMNFYEGHNRIIFNDGTNQTINITVNGESNNKIYKCSSSASKQILAVNRFSSWPGTEVYAYLWITGDSDRIAKWPGVKITDNQISENLYAIEVDKSIGYKYIIFNNGNDNGKTSDLTINFSEDKRYNGEGWSLLFKGEWNDYDP